MKHLITGASSFSGGHLIEYLRSIGEGDIVGCGLSSAREGSRHIPYHRLDIRDAAQVQELVGSEQPDVVYHLAGSSDEADPRRLLHINVEGTWNLLHACRQSGSGAIKVLLVGSSAVYGEMNDGDAGLSEMHPPRPQSFYGWSRHSALELGRVAWEKWGLPVYLCVPFNLIGPGLSDAYAPAALARRLMSARRKEETRFLLRNASAVRDYVDIRDAVRAYYSVVATGQSGICYNVGRGIPISILELVRTMASVLEVKVEIVPDESARWNERSGIRRSIADISRIQRETGWEPRMSFRESVRDLLLAVSRAEDL